MLLPTFIRGLACDNFKLAVSHVNSLIIKIFVSIQTQLLLYSRPIKKLVLGGGRPSWRGRTLAWGVA